MLGTLLLAIWSRPNFCLNDIRAGCVNLEHFIVNEERQAEDLFTIRKVSYEFVLSQEFLVTRKNTSARDL